MVPSSSPRPSLAMPLSAPPTRQWTRTPTLRHGKSTQGLHFTRRSSTTPPPTSRNTSQQLHATSHTRQSNELNTRRLISNMVLGLLFAAAARQVELPREPATSVETRLGLEAFRFWSVEAWLEYWPLAWLWRTRLVWRARGPAAAVKQNSVETGARWVSCRGDGCKGFLGISTSGWLSMFNAFLVDSLQALCQERGRGMALHTPLSIDVECMA